MIDLLYAQNVPAGATGDLLEHWFASFAVPGLLLGKNGTLRINMAYSHSVGASIKIFRLYYGGTAVYTDTPSTQPNHSFTTRIRNLNSLTSQLVSTVSEFTPAGATPNVPAAINTGLDQLLTFTGQLVVPSDTLSLDSFSVEYLRPGP